MQRIFDLRGVTKSYSDGEQQVRVLNNLSLEVNTAQSLVVTGPSGSGKSTLLNILAGLLDIDGGEIDAVAHGRTEAWHTLAEAERARWRRQHIGYVHQFFNLIPTLTVAENVLLVLQLNRDAVTVSKHDQRVRELLGLCGISHRADAFPEQLSGGEQQRTAVARALVHKPLLVLADEPTGNLDQGNAAQVADLLFEVAQHEGAGLVVATHSEAVAQRASRALSFESGA